MTKHDDSPGVWPMLFAAFVLIGMLAAYCEHRESARLEQLQDAR